MALLGDRESRLFINGALVAGSGGTFPTINPATEEVLGVAADATADDMGLAIAAARSAFDDTDWSTNVELRVQVHPAAAAGLARPRGGTARVWRSRRSAAPRMLTSMAQFDGPVEDLSFCADTAEGYQWTTDLGIAAPMGIKTRRTIAREAIGVVGAITPWNFPNQINLAKIGPALAAGNTVVLKPAPDTPWSAAVLGQLILEHTDIPAGVVNIVTSSDHGVGALLSKDPRVDMVSFTGSTNTGRAVMADGAATLKKVFLELGGKSAFLVLDDADLAGACSMSAFTASMHAGQGCAITTRLVVPRARYDEAVEAAASTMAGLKPGDPTDAGTICGPVISARQRDRIQGYLDSALAEGGRFACGGGQSRRSRQGFLHRADGDRGTRQQRQGGARGDLRPGADRHRSRRRRRRGAHRQRFAIRVVGHGVLARRGPRRGCRSADARRHRQRQRRGLVFGGHAVRRLQAIRHRPGDGARRFRGVPRDQGDCHGSTVTLETTQGDITVGLYGDQFNDKVAIVTGAGGGIGQVYAESLAREGAAVVVADINVEGAQKVADGIKGEGGNALAVRVDVSDPDSAKEMAATTLSEFGGIDYLVNNAAIFGGMKLDFLVSVDWDYYKKFMSVNMDGALLCTRAVYRKMAKRGGGAIVNQSSTAAWLYSNFYGLAKVGINGLTQQLATELGGQNIRINAIAPGPIDTEANRTTTPQEMVADIVKGIPLSRMGEPEDLVGMCLFLLSDQAKWITGQIFNVDGGQIFRS